MLSSRLEIKIITLKITTKLIRMKIKNIIMMILLLGLAGGLVSCNEKESKELSPDLIASNLAKNGKIDPELITGEWRLIKLAHTTNGNIMTRSRTTCLRMYDILGGAHYGVLRALDFTTESGIPMWLFGFKSSFRVEYTISYPNLIKLSLFQISFDLPNSPLQDTVVSALSNAYSFVIRNDELIIHFTGNSNRNLLIFQKR